MHRRLLWIWVVLLAPAVATGCGGDDTGGSGPMDGGTGGTGTGGIGGTGTGGTGGSGGTGTGGAQATTVECGTAICESPAAAMGFITACCLDEATSSCGTSLMSGPCTGAVEGDPRCPALDIMGFIMLPSCCTEGQCGIDASMFGMPGCIDLATAAEQAEMMAMGAGIELPTPRPCTDEDAGADDAGI